MGWCGWVLGFLDPQDLLLSIVALILGASRAGVLLDFGTEACGRADVLRRTFARLVQRDRASSEALRPSAEADERKLFTAPEAVAAKLFTIGADWRALLARFCADR